MPPETRSAAALALGAAGTAGTPGAAVELAVGLAAMRPVAVPLIALRLTLAAFGATIGLCLAIGFGAIRRAAALIALLVAALAVAILCG